ncbi:magnesium transporter [Rhodococcus erythropolis]|uniref:Magnesium transporter n=1 Tax=Rhodococcus erythropolis TaxID=1833 RepID=A0AAX3ZXZ3_RHOER|nr:magnesium transporter [Rhodococcus erythropolis]WMN01790.1 magnesium transporter [Rhodococcus erythropolis]
MSVLTVFLASNGPSDGVRDVLTDLSAAGLLDPFLWIDEDEGLSGVSGVHALSVDGGETAKVALQDILASRRVARVRLCVLVPFIEGAQTVRVESERAVADMLVSNSGSAQLVRIRMILTRGGLQVPDSAAPALAGWHNLLIAPEDSNGPGMGHVSLSPTTDPIVIGRSAAPVVAGIAGLWAHVEHAPFDDIHIVPGDAIRLVRSFYRRLETSGAEHDLRERVLDIGGPLPLPLDAGGSVVYVEDVPLATGTMAQNLWAKHRGTLVGVRVPKPADVGSQAIGLWRALVMFFSFMGSALRNAPMAFYNRVSKGISGAVASTVNSAVFGSDSSAYTIVVNGVGPDGRSVKWSDFSEASHQMMTALDPGTESRHHSAATDLSRLWNDYCAGALTLADAGERSQGLTPIQVGANRAVIRTAGDIVPGRDQRFTDVPGIIAASTGVSSLDAHDVLAISEFRSQLRELEQDQVLGLEARRTASTVDTWGQTIRRSYGFAFGQILAGGIHAARTEVSGLLSRLRAHTGFEDQSEGIRMRQRSLARWAQVITFVTVLILGTAGYATYREALVWWHLVLIVLVTLLVWFSSLFILFNRSQQELFQMINRHRRAAGELEADQANLRTALRDLDRLSAAYRQHVSWSAALGSFLSEPLGRAPARSGSTRQIDWGLPRSAGIGSARPAQARIVEVAERLRSELFTVGWMTSPWDGLTRSAGDHVGALGLDIRQNPELLYTKQGTGSGSALDVWSDKLAAGDIVLDGADVVWERALEELAGPKASLIRDLVSSIEVHDEGQSTMQSIDGFMAGVGVSGELAEGGYFDRTMLTDLASTSGRAAVCGGRANQVRLGLGLIAVTTQFSEGLSREELEFGKPSTAVDDDYSYEIPVSPDSEALDGFGRSSMESPVSDPFRAPSIDGMNF